MKLKMTKKKLLAAIVSTALLCGVGVGGTVAWLHDSAQVTNKFELADVSGNIKEEFNDKEKTNVKFTNTGNVDAYVRVALSVSLVNEAGEIVPINVPPFGDITDSSTSNDNYSIDWGDTEKWEYHDGYYYYLGKLAPDGSTPNLIDNITETIAEGEEYDLRVDVSAQWIQAEPASAVAEAWGVVISENGVSEAPQNP